VKIFGSPGVGGPFLSGKDDLGVGQGVGSAISPPVVTTSDAAGSCRPQVLPLLCATELAFARMHRKRPNREIRRPSRRISPESFLGNLSACPT
jgi:hypothetical protein